MINNHRTVLLASVEGENINYFAMMDATQDNIDNIDNIRKCFAESASKYFLVNKQYCKVDVFPSQHVAVVAALESNNRADGYLKENDKKCFEFLVNAVDDADIEYLHEKFDGLVENPRLYVKVTL